MYNPIIEVEIARQRYEEFAREAEMYRLLRAGAPQRPSRFRRMLAALRVKIADVAARNGLAAGDQANVGSLRDCQPQC